MVCVTSNRNDKSVTTPPPFIWRRPSTEKGMDSNQAIILRAPPTTKRRGLTPHWRYHAVPYCKCSLDCLCLYVSRRCVHFTWWKSPCFTLVHTLEHNKMGCVSWSADEWRSQNSPRPSEDKHHISTFTSSCSSTKHHNI